ncbi:hypothetical protein HHI36_006708 [Cryptolaemus montrouzieri]|uniref:Succinate dehydrogenase assembly factor 4, mitochondrial n=1 Tax=Cryptolaemus montrouzieri TaxID=559131 RepID=A0ABD2NYN4_9CUCU
MSIMMYMLRHVIKSPYYSQISKQESILRNLASDNKKPLSPRLKEFREKLKQTPPPVETELPSTVHPDQEKNPFPAFPDNTNPETGEVHGPKGPEPTRYGDWERKGRVSDF